MNHSGSTNATSTTRATLPLSHRIDFRLQATNTLLLTAAYVLYSQTSYHHRQMDATIAIPAVPFKTSTLTTSATALNIGILFQELVSSTLVTTSAILQTIFHSQYRHCQFRDVRLSKTLSTCCMRQFKHTVAFGYSCTELCCERNHFHIDG